MNSIRRSIEIDTPNGGVIQIEVIVDTGARWCVISEENANEFGLRPVGKKVHAWSVSEIPLLSNKTRIRIRPIGKEEFIECDCVILKLPKGADRKRKPEEECTRPVGEHPLAISQLLIGMEFFNFLTREERIQFGLNF